MRRLVFLLVLLLWALPLRAEEEDTPHRMLDANGEADTAKCGACHSEDMSLTQSKLETCTLCHAANLHAGAAAHLGASAEAVKQHLPEKSDTQLPLTDEGQIFCGTCHIFHDPRVSEEKPAAPWQPSQSALAQAVREATAAQWSALASEYKEEKPGAEFAKKHTIMLRLPVSDGSLCRHCHGSGGR